MDAKIAAVDKELRELAQVFDGEEPLLRQRDALSLARREGLLYRYSQTGNRYAMRWQEDGPQEYILENELCMTVARHIITVRKLQKIVEDVPILEETPVIEEVPAEVPAPKRTRKSKK